MKLLKLTIFLAYAQSSKTDVSYSLYYRCVVHYEYLLRNVKVKKV